jgi:hypothetical protein
MAASDHPVVTWTNLLASGLTIGSLVWSGFGSLPWWVSVPFTSLCIGSIGVAAYWHRWRGRPPKQLATSLERGNLPPPMAPQTEASLAGGLRFEPVDPATNDPHLPFSYREAFFMVRCGKAHEIPGSVEVGRLVEEWVKWQFHRYVSTHGSAYNEACQVAYYKKAYEELLAGGLPVDPAIGQRVAQWVGRDVAQRLSLGVGRT